MKSQEQEVVQEQKVKQEPLTCKGYLGNDPEVKTLDGGKQVANFSINTAAKGENPVWQKVQVWEENIQKTEGLKKGDLIELSGNYGKEYELKQGAHAGEFRKDFVAKDVKKVSAERETLTFKGNLVDDSVTKEIGEPKVKVSTFSIGYNDGEDKSKYVNCQAWHNSVSYNTPVDHLKKGDFVELSGYLGKEYTLNKGAHEGEKRRDLVVTECKVISHQLKRSASQEEKNGHLVEAVRAGNYKEVGIALKSGADKNAIKPEHYKGLSEKQNKAITDVIAKQDLKQEQGEKKNSGIKIK